MAKKHVATRTDTAQAGTDRGVSADTAVGLVAAAGFALLIIGLRKAGQADTTDEADALSSVLSTLDDNEAVAPAPPEGHSHDDELDAKFWISVLSNTFAGLIAAWVIFAVGSTVAMASRGGSDEGIRWGDAISAAGLCGGLGLTLSLAAWSVVALLRSAPEKSPSVALIVVISLVGALTLASWFFVLKIPGLVGYLLTLVLLIVLGSLWGALRLRIFSRQHSRLNRILHWGSLLLSVVGIFVSGVSIGSIFSRALAS